MGAELSSHLSELLARGEVFFSSQEAEQSLGLGHGAFLDAAERLQKQKKTCSPTARQLPGRSAAIRSVGRASAIMVH